MQMPQLSYAQRYEDMHLLRAFPGRDRGFYIDIGAGHPVYDNVSFAFYLRGWSGITVEPNPWLAELSGAVRPRDIRVQTLVGSQPGEATYYLVEDFHGLSTTVEGNARAALAEYGKAAKAMPVPVTTLAELCERHGAREIDFLKIDVEGAEKQVLSGNDWTRFRPKVVTLEALEPVTMRPAWEAWEPMLLDSGYRFAFFDTLNRYYVAQEHTSLAQALAAEPPAFEGVEQLRAFGPALEDRSHPDHRLADLLSGMDLVRLPLIPAAEIVARLTAGLPAHGLDRPATSADAAALHERLLGIVPADALPVPRRNATIRGLYEHLVTGESFRAACGRISASYAW